MRSPGGRSFTSYPGGRGQRSSALHSQRGEEARQWGTGLGPEPVGTFIVGISSGEYRCAGRRGLRASDRQESEAGCQRPGFTAASRRTG